jgi:hypoxanthine phosphoribosyltransferase
MITKVNPNLIMYLSKNDINNRLNEIGKQLSEKFCNECPVIIGILNGSFVFMADLIRQIEFECEIDFIKVNSYVKQETSGKVRLEKDVSIDIKDRRVIIIEDIIDSGLTIDFIRKHILGFNPKEVTIVTLLSKRTNYKLNFIIDIIGFEITSEFVVGYGLDLDQKFRQLDSLYKLDPKGLA